MGIVLVSSRRVRRGGSVKIALGLALLLAAGMACAADGICRVTTTADNTNAEGSNWTDAALDLQTALHKAKCTELWVKAGVYTPVVPAHATSVTVAEREVSFDVRADVAVYGGFDGTEDARVERAPQANLTVLSGDIDTNDTGSNGIDQTTADIVGANSRHVVTMDSATETPIMASTILDGLVITGGNADGGSTAGQGGGIYCNGQYQDNECSPTIRDVAFIGNRAMDGGAMYNDALFGGTSSPSLLRVAFIGNHATEAGGALFNMGQGGVSSPSLVDVLFLLNSADDSGGAMFNQGLEGISSPALQRVTFSGNSAVLNAGAMYSTGAFGGLSSPSLSNVTFSGNSAGYMGGAMVNTGQNGGIASPTLTNVTFTGNGIGTGGAGNAIANNGLDGTCAPVLDNVILWGDTSENANELEIYNNSAAPTISHSIVQASGGSGTDWVGALGGDGGGNLDIDPRLGPLGYNGGVTPTVVPLVGSSAIDSGDDALCPDTDQRGFQRSVGSHCDIGAVESQGPLDGDSIFANGFELPDV